LAAKPAKPVRREGRYRWIVVLSLASMTIVSYGTMLYAFSVLLGEDATAGEFGRALPCAALGLGVVVSGALAPLVGTLCDVAGSLAGLPGGSGTRGGGARDIFAGDRMVAGARCLRIPRRPGDGLHHGLVTTNPQLSCASTPVWPKVFPT
jgi:hypothetical protein